MFGLRSKMMSPFGRWDRSQPSSPLTQVLVQRQGPPTGGSMASGGFMGGMGDRAARSQPYNTGIMKPGIFTDGFSQIPANRSVSTSVPVNGGNDIFNAQGMGMPINDAMGVVDHAGGTIGGMMGSMNVKPQPSTNTARKSFNPFDK